MPGVGPARRRALLAAFGSVAALRDAGAPEIAARAGVPAALAERIAAHLAASGVSPAAARERRQA